MTENKQQVISEKYHFQKGTLLLIIMIIAMVFVNLIFLPSIIAGIVVLFNQQNIDYSYGNLVIEPRENQLVITNVDELTQKINRVPGVVASTPHYTGAATIVNKGKSTTPLLIAINPDDEKQVLKIHTGIASGDYLNDGDTGQILIGTTLADNKDQKVDRTPTLGGVDVGKTVEVTFRNSVTRQYRIKGIIASSQFSVDSSAFITIKELESVLGTMDTANQILMKTQTIGNEDAMRIRLMQYGIQEKIWTWQDKSERG